MQEQFGPKSLIWLDFVTLLLDQLKVCEGVVVIDNLISKC